MDAKRFDTLAKTLTGAHSRRSALGAAIAGGVLSAFGLGRGTPVRAAQGDLCVLAGPGGTCVLEFEAIVRQGPSARQPLVAGGTPGVLRGYLRFTHGGNGNMEDAELLLADGSSLPVAGLALGHGFQARLDLGQGRALVAVGVGEQDITRCLGRLDGTVTGTEIGDLGEWHATAGVQNIPAAAGGGAQTAASDNRPVSSADATGSQPAAVNSTAGGSNATDGGENNRPVAETSGTQPGSNPSGDGSESSGESGGNAGSGGSSPESSGSDRPVNDSSSGRPDSSTGDDGASAEALQKVGDDEMVLACPEGQTRCNNICVNTASDVFNCGACDQICGLDEDCTDGQCLAIDNAKDDGDVGAEVEVDATEVECKAGETRCDDTCVTLQTDINNCGACGIGCAGGEECVSGTCTPETTAPCPEGKIRCDGVCQDPLLNFGTEGLSCPGGGGIPTACPTGQELCNGACFPEGACQPTECSPGWGYCYGVCRDFQNDPGYCGGCSTGCKGGAYCSGGQCFYCSSNLTPCGADCVDTQTDLDNCGVCGNRCGTQCINGQCTAVGPSPTCAAGTTRCGDACVDLARDSANCGACGKVCGPNTVCYPPGTCGFSEAYCESQGKQACGLGCFFRHDPNHCGGCGFVCPLGLECDSKRQICYIIGDTSGNGVKPTRQQTLAPADQQTLAPTGEVTCAPGLDDCDGICSDLTTDMLHCGACGNACGAGSTCAQGQCATPGEASDAQTLAPTDTASEPQTEPAQEPDASESEAEPASSACPSGQEDCGGVCTDLSVDPLNCGACGLACGSDSTCDVGVCSEPPAPEQGEEPAPEDDAVASSAPPEATDAETAPAPDLEPAPDPVQEPIPDPVQEPDAAPTDAEAEPAP